ncbi:MAG: hypothetical protein H8E66_17670 [Planctomycetes bacterium]|nr:hypothetical protein [Planctomycetota bacterium]
MPVVALLIGNGMRPSLAKDNRNDFPFNGKDVFEKLTTGAMVGPPDNQRAETDRRDHHV